MLGGIILMTFKKRVKIAEYMTAFAAGALLAAAFIDVLPEAIEGGDTHNVLIWSLAGIIVFFLLESCISWFHKHGKAEDDHHKLDPVVPMAIIGDTLHNFIDGVAIAAAFLVSPTSGIVVTFAVAAHEIPQEIGDFGLLLHKGLPRKKVIIANILSSLVTVIAAVTFYLIGDQMDISMAPALGLVAGFFIYIAASDIIPTIHDSKSKKLRTQKIIMLLAGLIVVGLAVSSLHSWAHNHDAETEHQHTEVIEDSN